LTAINHSDEIQSIPAMWKLAMRGERRSPFTELGSYASLGDAAGMILKTENDESGAVLFRV
jgi:hypothetical protein